jgi:transposase, IS5 family
MTWTAHKRAQKDVDAKWTKKHGKNHFGYKLHASVDKRYKVIRKVIITDAAVLDTTVFEDWLDISNTAGTCMQTGATPARSAKPI